SLCQRGSRLAEWQSAPLAGDGACVCARNTTHFPVEPTRFPLRVHWAGAADWRFLGPGRLTRAANPGNCEGSSYRASAHSLPKGFIVSESTNKGLSRRDVMKTAGGVAVVSALAGVAIPAVHAAESNTIQLALVGCGGRGSGAAEDAMSTRAGPTKLVAMADV